MRARAAALGAGDAGERGGDRLLAAMAPIRAGLLADEVRLRQPKRSISVFSQADAAGLGDGLLYTAWGEVLRVQDGPGDADAARGLFQRALATPNPPAEAYQFRHFGGDNAGNPKVVAWANFGTQTLTLPVPRVRVVTRPGSGLPEERIITDGNGTDLDGAGNGTITLQLTNEPVIIELLVR